MSFSSIATEVLVPADDVDFVAVERPSIALKLILLYGTFHVHSVHSDPRTRESIGQKETSAERRRWRPVVAPLTEKEHESVTQGFRVERLVLQSVKRIKSVSVILTRTPSLVLPDNRLEGWQWSYDDYLMGFSSTLLPIPPKTIDICVMKPENWSFGLHGCHVPSRSTQCSMNQPVRNPLILLTNLIKSLADRTTASIVSLG